MSATGMNGTKWKLLFFAPVLRISRTDDRTKANKAERKRTLPIQAKFVLAKNTHYFAHFRIMALVTRFWRVTIAHIMAWLLWRVIRAMTQMILAYRYCAFGDDDFMSRYCTFNDTDFSCRYCRYNGAWFCVRNCRCNVVDLAYHYNANHDAPLSARYIAYGGVLFCRPTYAL